MCSVICISKLARIRLFSFLLTLSYLFFLCLAKC